MLIIYIQFFAHFHLILYVVLLSKYLIDALTAFSSFLVFSAFSVSIPFVIESKYCFSLFGLYVIDDIFCFFLFFLCVSIDIAITSCLSLSLSIAFSLALPVKFAVSGFSSTSSFATALEYVIHCFISSKSMKPLVT